MGGWVGGGEEKCNKQTKMGPKSPKRGLKSRSAFQQEKWRQGERKNPNGSNPIHFQVEKENRKWKILKIEEKKPTGIDERPTRDGRKDARKRIRH